MTDEDALAVQYESETTGAHRRIIRRYNVLGTHFDVDAR